MTLDTIIQNREKHGYYTDHHQYTVDDDLYDSINSMLDDISFPPAAIDKEKAAHRARDDATAITGLYDAINGNSTYYKPGITDISAALAVGLTPFYHKGTLYLAGNGDSRPRMDAYTMLCTGTIPTDSTALTDPERFTNLLGQPLATRAYNACKRTNIHEEQPPYDLETALAQFTGTENYYPSSFGTLNLTDGAAYLRDHARCSWLVDIIESYQPQLRGEDFQLWGITVNDDHSATVYCKPDSDEPNLLEQRIEYTDFPLREYELLVANNVLLLKSEY